MKFLNHSDDESWKNSLMEFFSVTNTRSTYNPHSIPVVPEEFRKFVEKKQEFRKWNENAHIPKFISIGPCHRGRSELQRAEGIKWRCITSLLFRVDENNYMELLEKCLGDIVMLDAVVRTSYGDVINLDRYELANVMLFDGFFLLELLLSVADSRDFTWEPMKEMKNMEHVLSDLMLVENQLPVVVLETLYSNLFREKYFANMIQSRALYFFGVSDDDPLNPSSYIPFAYHFLDIVSEHIRNIGGEEISREENAQAQHLNRCATRLEAVGITIKCLHLTSNQNATTPLSSIFQFFKHDIKFNKSSNGGRIILEIPHLDITRNNTSISTMEEFHCLGDS